MEADRTRQHFPGFVPRLKRTLRKYGETPAVFISIGSLAGIVPAVVIFLGLFPAILGTRPGQLDIISSPAIQLLTILLIMVLTAPLYVALGYAATRKTKTWEAVRHGLPHAGSRSGLRIAMQFDANVGHERYPIIDCAGG